MNYFVTGATGFIGKFLVEKLLQRQGTVYVLVRQESQHKLAGAERALRNRCVNEGCALPERAQVVQIK